MQEKSPRFILAKRLAGARPGDKVICNRNYLTVFRRGIKVCRVSLVDFPTPGGVVTKVMRNYRGFKSHLESMTRLQNEQGNGKRPIGREQKLVYVGTVDRILDSFRHNAGDMIRLMHPGEGCEMPLSRISEITGIRQGAIARFYNVCVVDAAARFIQSGLYLDFREELDG